ncbi:hypothetical protein S7335_2188 [Synechococcus sp. PCC 7335]|nr:hypothetical protein S7335_2188 [Synechococcus sp. PCC 7335]
MTTLLALSFTAAGEAAAAEIDDIERVTKVVKTIAELMDFVSDIVD